MAEKPEDLNLPSAVIGRMIKEVLPEGVNVSKEARAAISKSASVFVLYATSCANNVAIKNKRKTLSATDVFDALDEMEFEGFTAPLKEALEAFRKEQKGKKDAAEIKRKQKAESTDNQDSIEKKKKTNDDDEEEEEDAEEELSNVTEELGEEQEEAEEKD